MSTGVCNLGSINLTTFIIKDEETGEYEFDWAKFEYTIQWAVRFLDNINDISKVPLPEYKQSMVEKRRVGLGLMGLGSLFFMLKMKYGGAESLEFVEKLYKMKAEAEIYASALLGQEKGSFKLFDRQKYFNTYWWKNLKIADSTKELVESIGEMRNSHRSMNAPNGNTSIFTNIVSGGIEPVFMKEYIRWMIVPESDRSKLKDEGLVYPDIYNGEWKETKHFKFSKKGDEEILKGTFNGQDYEIDKNRGLVKSALVEDYGWRFAKQYFTKNEIAELEMDGAFDTTEKLGIDNHVDILKIISHYTDHNNSKTVNIPADYSYKDFEKLYMNAWKSNIKGLTSYRAGTMTVVLEEKKKIEEYQNELDELFDKSNGHIIEDVKLPYEYHSKGFIRRDKYRKKWYIHVAFADSHYRKPFAIFVNTNSKESSEVADEVIHKIEQLCRDRGIKEEIIEIQREKYSGQTNVTKIARAIGLSLRHNIKVFDVVEVLDEFDHEFSSFVFHMKKILQQFVKDGTRVKGEDCPECGRKTGIVYQEGCKSCKFCGYSKCD